MTKPVQLQDLAYLRAAIGYLGEKEQFNWWPSSFFGPGSSAFLTPVFSRTALLARLTAVTTAAARLHDEFIGVGSTYHLFRLPEDLEQDLHAFYADQANALRLNQLTKDPDAILDYLQQVQVSAPGAGPKHMGGIQDLRTAAAWQAVAAYYVAAFVGNGRTYPYFADRTA